MKTRQHLILLLLAFVGLHRAGAQGPHFFQIAGPAPSQIVAFRSDGTLVWSNGLSGTTYTVQACSSLPAGTNWVDYVQIPVTQSVSTNLIVAFNPPAGMALIPAGVFTIGDTLDGEPDAIPTNVYVSGFYMDTNLVSYSQWQTVYSYATNHGYIFVNAGAGKAANQPVQMVDWNDVVKWSNARSQQAGLTPVYYTDAGLTQVYTNGETTNVFANWTAGGYRLPTEAEWEKAARGGLIGQRFPWGDTISESQANYEGLPTVFPYDLGPAGYNATGEIGGTPYTTPVGTFAANGYGLYDMAGNVQEWCWDWYAGPPYPAGSPYLGGTNPQGPASSPSGARVICGGLWFQYASVCRCANRTSVIPSNADDSTGFRCVMGL
jgi:formylglycine-generating enzyme required for sulfatase activity